jgi:hypothetical protein
MREDKMAKVQSFFSGKVTLDTDCGECKNFKTKWWSKAAINKLSIEDQAFSPS